MFETIRPRRLSDEIVRQIRRLIQQGALAPGDRLPPEVELARQFGVSRPTLRDALADLARLGLVETRRPGGTFVRSITPRSFETHLAWLLEEELSHIGEFLETRKLLEAHSAAEAARRATRQDIRRIEAALREMDEAIATDDSARRDAADIAFHTAIVQASNNAVILPLIGTFTRLMYSTQELRRLIRNAVDPAGVAGQHRAVYEAIVDRRPDRAADRMVEHIDAVKAAVTQLLQIRAPGAGPRPPEIATPAPAERRVRRPASPHRGGPRG